MYKNNKGVGQSIHINIRLFQKLTLKEQNKYKFSIFSFEWFHNIAIFFAKNKF